MLCGEFFYVGILARLLQGRSHVFVGGGSPAAAAASLLARELSGGRLQVTLLGSSKHNGLTDDFAEIFDMVTTGRFDAFFIGGGQIDGEANVNLVGIGDHPSLKIRWPGSRGTPQMYMMIPNSILFNRDHTRRALVSKVDFISAPGVSPGNVYRPGGPVALVTPRCLFAFDRIGKRFSLTSLHPGHSLPEVIENTGFTFDVPKEIAVTPAPNAAMAKAMKDSVLPDVAELYPKYVEEVLGEGL